MMTGTCLNCGVCCSSAFLALDNIPVDKDEQEIALWLSHHGCQPMVYKSAKGEDVLAVKIPIPCKHLIVGDEKKSFCAVYEKRPKVCRNYFCEKAKSLQVALEQL